MAKQTPNPNATGSGGILVSVFDAGSTAPLENASVSVWRTTAGEATRKGAAHPPAATDFVEIGTTQSNGRLQFDGLAPMTYLVVLHHLQVKGTPIGGASPQYVEVRAGCVHDACFELALNARETQSFARDDCTETTCPREGDGFGSQIDVDYSDNLAGQLELERPPGTQSVPNAPLAFRGVIGRAGQQLHPWKLRMAFQPVFAGAPASGAAARLGGGTAFAANARTPQPVSGNLGVALSRTSTASTADLAFWQGILNSTEQLSFNNYLRFMNMLVLRRAGSAVGPAALRAAALQGEAHLWPGAEVQAPLALHRFRRLPRRQGRDRSLRHDQLRRARADAALRRRARPGLPAAARSAAAPLRQPGAGVQRRVPGVLPRRRRRRPDAAVPGRDPLQAARHLDQAELDRHRSRPRRPMHRHPAGQAHQPLPARTDLVVLARRRDAGADDERDHAALPERARGRARPAGQPRDRSAAAAEQRAVGLRAGRAASPVGRAPQLRVRPPLRPAARRRARSSACRRPTAARVSSKPSTTCCACARCSSSRTTTPRSRPTRSRCSMR